MHPSSFDVNPTDQLRLRRHIRDVLLSYARVHLTSDHVAYTEKVVEELLLQTLECVPMADATSFFLPTEPLEVLMRSLDSLDLTPPEEKWVAPAAHISYLRTFFHPPCHLQDLPTEKYWHEEDNYAKKISLMCRPISSPILSGRARRETPQLGGTNYLASIPRTNSTLTTYLGLNVLSVPNIEDLPTPPVDDVLDLRLELNSDNNACAQPMTTEKVGSFEDTPNVPEFLNHESPPRRLHSLDSPPLFPRAAQRPSIHGDVRGNMKTGISKQTRVPDLVSVLQMASPEVMNSDDGDINIHHMEVVSGWTTLKYSSPPPPSLHSSEGSEVDELWEISSPGTPATSLMAAKMDEVEIPRIRKFGHKNTLADQSANRSGTADLLTVAKSPGFFITSFISAPIPMAQAHKSITSQLEGVESSTHSPHPLSPGQNTSNSLLGQPPSAPEKQDGEEALTGRADFFGDFDFEEQRFDDAIASVYLATPQDPFSFIREEKLDDKDILLMDVPNLPPPTAHQKDPILFSTGMQTFVEPKGELSCLETASYGKNSLGLMSFLKLVKGIKPLALELSWRPFNFGKAIPTDEEVTGVAKSIQPESEIQGYCDEKYMKTVQILLGLSLPTSAEEVQPTLTPKTPRGYEEFGMSPAPKRTEESEHIGYLLTKRERLRAKITLDADGELQGDVDIEQCIAPWSLKDANEDALAQDENPHQHEYLGSQNLLDLMDYCSRNRSHCFDDSGIDIMDDNIGQPSTSEATAPLRDTANNENVPPWDLDDYQLGDSQLDPLEKHHDWNSYFEFPESETLTPPFEPLPFASQCQPLEPSGDFLNSIVQDVPPPTPVNFRVKRPEDDPVSTGEDGQTSRVTKRRKLDNLVPASSKDLFSTFIGLRSQVPSSGTIEHSEPQDDTPTSHQVPDAPEPVPPRTAPDDISDQHTVRLPDHWIPAAAAHRYLVSMALIQKRALVRALQGHQCLVALVERYDLGGTDIIIDPDYGVLFIPLLALPANIGSAVERISVQSWRYLHLLVVFEAFPSTQSSRADHSRVLRPVPYAYTPLICKAIKKLRRNLGISEGCGTMNPGCTITWAFANNVEEAAKFVRCYGEEACAISTERGRGMLWDEREWLEEGEREGESDLARVHGMNTFAAFVMLYDRSLGTILEMAPEARLAEFGPLLGQERMTQLNAVIDSRLREIEPDIADSVVDPGY